MDDEMVQQWQQKFDAQRGGPTEENISKAELRLTDIADTVQGREWIFTQYACVNNGNGAHNSFNCNFY